jgi:hypothetical protein
MGPDAVPGVVQIPQVTYTGTPNYATHDIPKFGFSRDQIFERLLYKFIKKL